MQLGRQKRKVRIFIQDGPTIQGILATRTRHEYVVWAPRIVTEDEREPEVKLSEHVEIPRERVLFYQVIG